MTEKEAYSDAFIKIEALHDVGRHNVTALIEPKTNWEIIIACNSKIFYKQIETEF